MKELKKKVQEIIDASDGFPYALTELEVKNTGEEVGEYSLCCELCYGRCAEHIMKIIEKMEK